MKFIQHTILVTALSIGIAGVAMAIPQELVDGLGDESYQLREKAEQDLTLWAKKNGKKSLGELSDLKKKSQSPEVQSRLDNVISRASGYKAIPGTRGYMGILLTPELGAAGVSRLVPNTPAAKSGLQPNDKIIEIDGVDLSKKNNGVHDAMTFVQRYVKTKKAGEKLTLKIDRDGKKLSITLKLEDYDKQMKRDPFGNGGLQIQPMPQQRIQPGIQGRLKLIPRPENRNINPRQLKLNEGGPLKLKLEFNLQKELKLEEKKIPKK